METQIEIRQRHFDEKIENFRAAIRLIGKKRGTLDCAAALLGMSATNLTSHIRRAGYTTRGFIKDSLNAESN